MMMTVDENPVKKEFLSEFSFQGWSFSGKKGPLINAYWSKKLSEESISFPLPTMTFPETTLKIAFQDRQFFSFDCVDALNALRGKPAPFDIKVVHSNGQGKSFNVLDYDWTYFAEDYEGSYHSTYTLLTNSCIPFDLLADSSHEILHFNHLDFYEDEIGDGGCSKMDIRLRVMQWGWFVCLRLYLRVDWVISKIKEVRFCHQFGEDFVGKDVRLRQGIPAMQYISAGIDTLTAMTPILKEDHFRLQLPL